jgi:hypothetical protein
MGAACCDRSPHDLPEVQESVLGSTEAKGGAMSESEVCICAAILLDDGRIIRGHRHDDCIQTAQKWQNAGQNIGRIGQDQQGFVTSRNRFVDRAEGARLMREVGHVTPAQWVFRSDTLFSEDLY